MSFENEKTPARQLQQEHPLAISNPVVTSFSQVPSRPVNWLWPRRIALGKLTFIVGDPGIGKSFITVDMAARVSRGRPWPDAPQAARAPAGAVLLSGEDDPSDTIRPRLEAAGADLERIVTINSVSNFSLETGREELKPFNLADHIKTLELALYQMDDARLVIIDPISAYLGPFGSVNNVRIRELLSPLTQFAAACDLAVVAVTHLRKTDGPALYRAMGSLAFMAAARGAYCVMRDQEDPAGARRLFLPVKNNLGNDRQGMAFQLAAQPGQPQPSVIWEPTPVSTSVDEALRAGPQDRQDRSQVEEAASWLSELLARGPLSVRIVLTLARRDGLSHRTLEREKNDSESWRQEAMDPARPLGAGGCQTPAAMRIKTSKRLQLAVLAVWTAVIYLLGNEGVIH